MMTTLKLVLTRARSHVKQVSRVVKKNTSISLSQHGFFGIPMDSRGNVKVPNAKAPDTDKQLTRY